MRIRVTQSGGQAGAEELELASLDTERLHAQAAGRVRGRLAAEGFFSLPAHATGGGAGGPRYRIVVEEGGDRHSVTFEDDGSPAAATLKALVEALAEEADAQAKTLNQARSP